MEFNGLTEKEVAERVAAGKVNRVENQDHGVRKIFFSNIFTYFNGIFALLGALVIIVGAYKNLTFLIVVICNMIIGIIQQLYAKRALDKLSLLDVTEYTVIRDGRRVKVPSDQLVLDDLVLIKGGQQIPADAVVVDGSIAANESLLTGEADEIEKKVEAELKSGSFAVSGECIAKLTRVGKDSYAAALTAKAKESKERKAEMIKSIDRIILVAGITIIPVGVAMISQHLYVNGASFDNFKDAVLSMVSAVVGMIPEGLYLLMTIALALSAARLAGKKVMLHDMHSIETLARVDILCVDKTGTITCEDMNVTEIFPPKDLATADEELLRRYVQTVPDSNITMQALRKYLGRGEKLDTVSVLPFSSKNKYSEVQTASHTYRLGAPEYLLSAEAAAANQALINERAGAGERVLALTGDGSPLLFVALNNAIRENAPEIFKYFADRDVKVMVISGDNPLTVSRVAAQAGIPDTEHFIDATDLQNEFDIADAVREYTVFGRVKPEQKKMIVEALRRQGRKVAMTGDGVNDILAMKEADCSIAMGAGSDAARQAAQVVLLDNDFSRMKNIVGEGRRDVNNITRSATLFLYKNIFSLLLAIFSLINVSVYPLQPNQVSLISMFNIGIPAFLLALEKNEKKQEGGFIKTTILHSLPASLTSFFSIAFMVLFGQLFEIPSTDIATASTYLLALIGFMILWKISKPANTYHIIVFIICIAGLIFCSRVPFFSSMFDITSLSLKALALCVVFAIAEITIMNFLTWLFENFGKITKRIRRKISIN